MNHEERQKINKMLSDYRREMFWNNLWFIVSVAIGLVAWGWFVKTFTSW